MRLNKSSKDEQQRFRGTTASAISLSGNAATSSSPSTRRVFTQQSAANATSSQRVAALFHDVKRYIRQKQQQRHWRSNDSLPLNHSSHGNKYHKVGSTSDKAWHVDIPKRMVFSTMLVFLLLPLTIFYWKETHLPDQEESAVVESKIVGYNQQSLHSSQHNAFPNWFADSSLPHSSSDSSRDDENDLRFNDNNNNNNIIPQQQREDATPGALKALESKVTQPLLDDATNTTAHDIQQQQQQQQDPDVLELSKVQFVNDTEIPDNDPLSDPETAPKISGGRVDDDDSSSSSALAVNAEHAIRT